jgi:hypothetical protein
MNTSYSVFLVTHPPLFSGGKDPLEADDWLRTTKSKFSLLHCTEYQKTLYAAQQLIGPAKAWWASYTAALPTNDQEGTMKACEAAEEKKRKRAVSGLSRGSSRGAPRSTA